VLVDTEEEAFARRQKRFLGLFFAFLVVAWALLTTAVPATGMSKSFLFVLALSGGLWWVVAMWLAVPAAGIVAALVMLWKRRYRGAALCSLVPAIGVLLVLYAFDIGDIVHFWLYNGRYDRVVSDVVAGRCSAEDRRGWKAATISYECQAPAIVAFERDSVLSSWRGIVYDATDEIAKPPTQRSAAWKNRETASWLDCSPASLALGGHYYAFAADFGSCP
jgi:hypothetical protein